MEEEWLRNPLPQDYLKAYFKYEYKEVKPKRATRAGLRSLAKKLGSSAF